MVSAVFRVCSVLLLLLTATVASAQSTVNARRLYLGATGTTCTFHSDTGVPSSGLGAVCDVYVRKDSPYTVYVKTGGSTWTAIVRLPGDTGITTVGALDAGSITSGFGSIDVGADGVAAATGVFSTSVTTPTLTASANLTLSPTGDVVFNPTGNDLLPTTGYDLNIGALTNKFLTLHAAELWVETLVAQNTLATIGGRVLVGPTTTLTSDLSSGATSMSVKHNSLANGDRVLPEANGSVEWIAVASASSGSGPYTYTITRNLDGSGANNWVAGDAVFNTGTTNSGFIDLYSSAGVISGSGPTIVGNVRTGTTYNNIAARWAIGNLNGLYGYGATTYGTAFGDPSATNVTIDATNGFRIRNSTTNKFAADTSGNLSITGDLCVGTSGLIRSGATSYVSGTGYVLDYNGGTPRLRVGTTAANRLTWDGTDLTVVSDTVTIDTNGIKIASWNTLDTSCPGSCQDLSRSYAFTPASAGFMGLQGLVGTVSGAQELHLVNDVSGGSSPYARTYITAEGTTIDMSSLGSIGLTASSDVHFGAGTSDLTIFTNNSTTTGNPYMRSNGSYLAIESRSNANGGFLTLNGDQAADVYLTQGGGTTRIYTALVLNGLASCTLQVNGAGAVGCVSDASAKRDIKSWSSGLSTVNRLRPVSYRWAEGDDKNRHIGFIAQDVESVIPEAVSLQDWGKMHTLDDRAILAALVNAVNELSKKVKR
ncbi:MAG: tail fiber domain-containing protein [Desulfurellales bacterium]|nr:MAG: tail fiber domain-containing protein [Desulfurellales bacterium]